MNFQLKVRSKAESDLAEAIRYYEEKVSGLGLKMLTSFNDTIFLISRNPKSFPLIHKQFRRAMIPHFPYGIFFMLRENSILIVRIFYLGRNPELIRDRLE